MRSEGKAMTNPYGNYNQNSPWPVYGSGNGAGEGGQGSGGQNPSAQGSGDSGSSPWGTAPDFGAQTGMQPGAYYAGQAPNPAGAVNPNLSGVGGAGDPNYLGNLNHLSGMGGGVGVAQLPSRTGSIWTLAIGLVALIIIAPASFFVVAMSNALDLLENADWVYSGDTVTVDDSTFTALAVDETSGSCMLTDASGNEYNLAYSSVSDMYSATGLTPGQYVFTCQGYSTTPFVILAGDMEAELVEAVVPGMITASILGVIGLIVTIVGIVKLVKVNGERRLVAMQQMQNSGFGGYRY